MYIYKITNTANGKVYIGQTIRPVKNRFNRHMNDAINNIIDTHFSRAIRKYGRDSFVVDEIDSADSQEELTIKEMYWINYYDSINCGYNETCAEYKCGGNTYMSKSDGEMVDISDKLRASKLGSNNPNSRRIKCKSLKTGEELFFDTVKECKEYFGENTHRFVSNRVSYNTVVPYKDEWMIAYEENDYMHDIKRKAGSAVIVYDRISDSIMHFKSIRESSRYLSVSKSSIKDGGVINNRYEITIPDKKCIDYPR